jgi:hypothetical protein
MSKLVSTNICCLPFKKIDAITAVAMAEQVKIDTASMWVITRFLDGCLMPHPGETCVLSEVITLRRQLSEAIEKIAPLGIEEDIMTPLGVEYSCL